MEKKNLSQKIRIVVGFNGRPISEKIFTQFPISIGRDEICDLQLDYGFVSRRHCEIIEDQGKFHIIDLNSRNGIYVDGKQGRIFEIVDKLEFQVNVVSVQISIFDEAKVAEEKKLADDKKRIDEFLRQQAAVASLAAKKIETGPKVKKAEPVVRADEAEYVDLDAYRPLVSSNIKPDIIGFHPKVNAANAKRVEAVVVWQGEILQVREFEESEQITIGPTPQSEIQIPLLPAQWKLADVNFTDSVYHVYKGLNFSLSNDGLNWSDYQPQHPNPQSYKLSPTEMVRFQIAPWLSVYLRYVPAQHRLTRKKLSEPEKDFRNAIIGSAIAHFGFSFILAMAVPKVKQPTKAKIVQERFARVIVPPPPVQPPPPPEEPKPIVEVKPEPKPEPIPEPPKKVVQEQPKPKKEKPKPVVKKEKLPPPVVQKKVVEKVVQNVVKNTVKAEPSPVPVKNVAPVVVKSAPAPTPAPPPKPAVKVESLGALAALGLGSGPAASSKSEAPKINIQNSNAVGTGPARAVSMNAVVSGLPTGSGKVASGGGSIKTKGNSSGVGTDYSTQGLSTGGAGSRAIAGKVVGQPKLSMGGASEGLTRNQVSDVVKSHAGEIQRCYEKSLLSNPDLGGTMEFEWDIAAVGNVNEVRIKKSTIAGGDILGDCVKGVFKKMKFPAAKNGQSTTPNITQKFGRSN